MSFLDNFETTVLRCVVNYPDVMRKTLASHGINFFETRVLAVEMDSVLELSKVCNAILSAEVKIHHMYSLLTRPNGKVGIIVQTENNEFAAAVMHRLGIKTIAQNDIGR
jgi:hypothetical protein